MENTIPQNTGSRTDIGPSICDPVDFSPPGSSIHGILQARILEWVATSFSRDLPDPGIEPRSPALEADTLTSQAPGKPFSQHHHLLKRLFLFQDKCVVCMRTSLRDRGSFCSLDYEFQPQGWDNIHTSLQQNPELCTPLPNNFPLPKWIPIPGCYGNSADSLYSQNKHAFSEMYT